MNACKLVGSLLLPLWGHAIPYAQQVRTVRGRVQAVEAGSNGKRALSSASVITLAKSDSAFIKGITSDKNGRFILNYQPQKKKRYLLKVSFTGMQSIYRALEGSVSMNIGTVVLRDDDIQISEVTITGKLQGIAIEGGTTVINAAAFKTREGAYLEDLVERVPGLIYNKKNNSLTYNGQPISEINVNGEASFSGDKRTALKNLSADLISKLKVCDKKSKEEEFTGISSGKKKYVLGLQTKDELNKTWLASVMVGYGNNQKEDFGGQVNYFSRDGDNPSFITQSTNRYQNSTCKDSVNNSVGVNMAHKFGRKFSLTGSMNYDLDRNGNLSSIYREQHLPTGNQYSASTNENSSKRWSISSNFMGSWEVDKRTHTHFTGNLEVSPNRSENSSQNASFDTPSGISHKSLFDNFESISQDIKVSRGENRSHSGNQSNRYSWMMGIVRHLNEEDTTLALNILNSDSWGNSKSFSLSKTTYFRLEDKLGNGLMLSRNQYLKSPQRNNSWRVGIIFAQPIGKKTYFQVAYNWDTNYKRGNCDTYKLSLLTKSEVFGELPPGYKARYVDSLSNRSHSRTNGHDLGVGLNYSDGTWMFNASLGMTPQKRAIERKMGKLHADTTVHTVDLQPMMWVNWGRKEARIASSYSGRTRQPPLSDLMPLTDNSNPLYVTRRNPDLKQMLSHSVRVSFQHSKKGISANIGGQMGQSSVTQVVLYGTKTGGCGTSPININGSWNVYGSVSWQKRLGYFSLQLGMNGNHSNRVSMINEDKGLEPKESTTRNTGSGCDANVLYQPTWGGIDLSASWNYRYSLNSINDSDTYTRNYSSRLEGYADLPSGLQLRTDGVYPFRSGTNIRKDEDDQILWNASASWWLLKEKEAELSAYWADIPGKEKSFGRTTSSDGFYESRSQEIKGYFIVTFRHNFRLMM